jgi:Ca-activated chloride channel family protein
MRGAQRIFTFGVGAELSVTLLEQLALEGGGTANFVRPEEHTEHIVSVVASRLTNPVVTDLRLRAEGVRLHSMLPGGAQDLFAGQDLVLLARYDGSGPARLRFEGRTASGPVSWETTVTLPERDRDNAFIPRLWATQRIGWLSAEKRKNGASREIDDEIRMLGERYAIPTEFSSYLVLEPGMVAANGMRLQDQAGAPRAAPADVQRRRTFEAAKTATAQREARSLATADSAAAGSVVSVRGGAATASRRVGNRVFAESAGVWTDVAAKDGMRTVRIKPYAAAYFKVLEMFPELREPLALGDRVRIAGRGIILETADDGMAQLSDATVQALRQGF